MERHFTGESYVEYIGRWWISAQGGAARHYMRVATGEDDDLTGFERDWLTADKASKAAASCHHMIGNQMIGTGQDFRQDRMPVRRSDCPRILRHNIEERRAGQPHRSQ